MRGPLDHTSIYVHAELHVVSSQENAEEQPVPFFFFPSFSVGFLLSCFLVQFFFFGHKINCLQVFVS